MEFIDPNQLIPHPRNVRLHNRENIEAIKKSLETFGQQRPLVVDAENQVIAGCGTLESIKELGWSTVQIVRTQLTGMQAELYAIADNKTTDMSEFNYALLAEVLRDAQGKNLDLTTSGFQNYETEPLLLAEFDAGPAGAMPTEADADGSVTVKFTKEQWESIQQALADVRTLENCEYDTESDAAAISVIAYYYDKSF